jgi:hypothetical protein
MNMLFGERNMCLKAQEEGISWRQMTWIFVLLLTQKDRRQLCMSIGFSKYKVFRSYLRAASMWYIIEFSALDK